MKNRYWKSCKRGEGAGIAFLRSHVDYAGNDCLIWPLCRNEDGYGKVGYLGRVYRAHRLMCELAHGQAPSAIHQATHSCGQGHTGCVNPKHLSWQTPSENQRDRRKHGTQDGRGGERHKLTAEDVAAIRASAGTKTHFDLAVEYGCTRENISRIIRGVVWRTGKKEVGGFTVKPFNRHARAMRAVRPQAGDRD